MEKLVEKRDGWWWPKYDVACWRFLSRRSDLPAKISKYCTQRRVVLQAGGNAGMYPAKYAELFETVYTFEPDPLNFYCLTKNVPDNVVKIQSCLGESHNFVNLSYNEMHPKKPNSGGLRVNGIGTIPTLRIDDFNFDNVDLIHFDIEGFELFALKGAVETIKRCKPLIALELNGLAEKFNHSDNDVTNFLSTLGYVRLSEVDDDIVFRYNR
jgi:FkbM family methyltransferase